MKANFFLVSAGNALSEDNHEDASLVEEDGGLTCANVDVSLQEDDLPNYDLLRRFNLDNSEVGLVQKIEGTGPSQSAYRLQPEAQFALATADLLPGGLPSHFSFSCTFRRSSDVQEASQNRSWTLLRINDNNGEAQWGIRLLPSTNTVQFYTTLEEEGQEEGHLQQFNFTDLPYYYFEDGASWSKLHLSVTPTSVSLYINCQKVGGFELTESRKQAAVDLTGDTWLAKYDDDFSTVPVRF